MPSTRLRVRVLWKPVPRQPWRPSSGFFVGSESIPSHERQPTRVGDGRKDVYDLEGGSGRRQKDETWHRVGDRTSNFFFVCPVCLKCGRVLQITSTLVGGRGAGVLEGSRERTVWVPGIEFVSYELTEVVNLYPAGLSFHWYKRRTLRGRIDLLLLVLSTHRDKIDRRSRTVPELCSTWGFDTVHGVDRRHRWVSWKLQ